MLDFLKNFFNFRTTNEKLLEYEKLLAEKKELNKSIDDFANKYSVMRNNHIKAINSEDNKEILKSIEERYGVAIKKHQEDVDELVRQNKKIKKGIEKVLSDKNIQKAIEFKTKYEDSKKLFHKGLISLKCYDNIIKGLTSEKVKYADNIVLNQEGKLLLLKRSSWEDTHKCAWVIPGGHVDQGETFEQAAKRELTEESGYSVENVKKVGKYEDNNVEIEYYLSYIDTTEIASVIDFYEIRDLCWIDINDIDNYEMILNMKDNIKSIMNIKDQPIVHIKKALKNKINIPSETLIKAINTPTQSKKVAKVMSEYKKGKLKSSSGGKVTDQKQAVAIALSEAGLSKANSPCWRNYEMVGTKIKDGKEVPNCVPIDKAFEKAVKLEWDNYEVSKAENGETPKQGEIKSSSRKGKKAMVYMGNKWHHFGDSKMKHNYSDKARASATARHKKNLEGTDDRAKAFRVYWRKYWGKGGSVKTTDTRKSEIENIEKGVYADTPANRKLGRVGQLYGKKEDDSPHKEEKKPKKAKKPIVSQAKKATDKQLESAIEDPDQKKEVKQIASEELKNRKKTSITTIISEKEPKKQQVKKLPNKKSSSTIVTKLKEEAIEAIDNLDSKALSEVNRKLVDIVDSVKKTENKRNKDEQK